MNIGEMHAAVNLGFQRIASNIYEDFLPEEIDFYLNNSQIKVVNSVADSEAVLETIYPIIKEAVVSLQRNTSLYDVFQGSLPSDYMHHVKSVAKTELQQSVPRILIRTKFIDNSEFYSYLTTIDDRPFFRALPLTVMGDEVRLILKSDLPDIDELIMTYIRYPSQMNLESSDSCELPVRMHQLVVDAAVDLMVQDVNKHNSRG